MSGVCGVQNLRRRQIYSRFDGGEEELAPKSVRWVGKLKHLKYIVRACVHELYASTCTMY